MCWRAQFAVVGSITIMTVLDERSPLERSDNKRQNIGASCTAHASVGIVGVTMYQLGWPYLSYLQSIDDFPVSTSRVVKLLSKPFLIFHHLVVANNAIRPSANVDRHRRTQSWLGKSESMRPMKTHRRIHHHPESRSRLFHPE